MHTLTDNSSTPAWRASVRLWTASQRRIALFLLVAATVLLAVSIGSYEPHGLIMPDADQYMAMAQGHDAAVMQPFASRQLAVLLARLLAATLHLSLLQAFILQGIACLVVLSAIVYRCILRWSIPRCLLPLFVLMPFWPSLYRNMVLPDLMYAALLAVFLLLLWNGRLLAAACMMLPLMLTRESTSLTLVCLLLAAWGPLRWAGRIMAVAATVLGAEIVKHLSAHALPNQEHLSGAQYLLGKFVWNGIRALGVLPWSNVYPNLCAQPKWLVLLHIGPVRSIGLCQFSAWPPLITATSILTVFGVLPLIVLVRRRSIYTRSLVRATPVLRFSLLYGTVSFLLAPFLGTASDRLFSYAWPLLLVALPAFLQLEEWRVTGMQWASLLAVQIGLLLLQASLMTPATVIATLVLGLAGYLLVRVVLGRRHCVAADPVAAPAL